MNTDVEELLREGMERFTAGVRAPAGLADTARRLHRRRLAVRAAVACGTAATTAAAVLGWPEGTVKSAASRGLRRLRELAEGWHQPELNDKELRGQRA